MKLALRSIVVSCALVFAATPALATPIDVRVLSATYSVTVTVGGHPEYVTETKTSTDSSPVSESLYRNYIPQDTEFGMFGDALAIATADLLDVSTFGLSAIGTSLFTISSADTQFTFSPLADGVADFTINGGSGVFSLPYSASLFDVTTNTQMWEFSLLGGFFHETVPTFLDGEHVYSMHLHALAVSQADGVDSEMHVSGIRAVPDTVDSFVCLCMGLFAAVLGTWQLRT
jgi:hypothetical protein